MKTLSLKLPPSLSAKLDRAAKKRGQTKSAVVRAALEQFLNGHEVVPPGSALEAVQPWVGCAEGPRDLATNPKYMEGFGECVNPRNAVGRGADYLVPAKGTS
jgi:Ribbon-helix-helix protein, copG family